MVSDAEAKQNRVEHPIEPRVPCPRYLIIKNTFFDVKEECACHAIEGLRRCQSAPALLAVENSEDDEVKTTYTGGVSCAVPEESTKNCSVAMSRIAAAGEALEADMLKGADVNMRRLKEMLQSCDERAEPTAKWHRFLYNAWLKRLGWHESSRSASAFEWPLACRKFTDALERDVLSLIHI